MIACLGWGSLIWNPDGLPVADGWSPDGPQLPIEFARVSGRGRLTLVVTKGAPSLGVFWSRLTVRCLDEGIEALAAREDITPENIRYSIGIWSPARRSRHEEAEAIGQWAAAQRIEAVVWTALKPGFPESRGVVPSCEQALDYLRSLEGPGRASAEEYVRRAPVQISTPYRSAIERELGWTPLCG